MDENDEEKSYATLENVKLVDFDQAIDNFDYVDNHEKSTRNIFVGSVFTSFQEFKTSLERWKDENFHPFRVSRSDSLTNADGSTNNLFKYRYVVYQCAFFGGKRLSGGSLFFASSNGARCGCRAMLRLDYNPNVDALEITKLNVNHFGHDVSAVDYASSSNSTINEDEIERNYLKFYSIKRETESAEASQIESTATPIEIGAKFRSFHEFQNEFERWKEENYHPFRIASSDTLHLPGGTLSQMFRYRSLVYRCTHYGTPRKRGKGEEKRRHVNYLSCGCRATLRINYSSMKNALIITTLNVEHTGHKVSANSYERFKSKNKRFSIVTSSDGEEHHAESTLNYSSSISSSSNVSPSDLKRPKLLIEQNLAERFSIDFDARKTSNDDQSTIENGNYIMQNLWQKLSMTDDDETDSALTPNLESSHDVSLIKNSNVSPKKYTGVRKKCKLTSANKKNKLQLVECYDLKFASYQPCGDCGIAIKAGKKLETGVCRFQLFRICVPPHGAFTCANQTDVAEWWSNKSSNPLKISSNEACYLLKNLSTPFKKFFQAEKEFFDVYRTWEILGKECEIPWKKPMNYRELCDICSATVFNLHLFCPLCGYSVCLKCSDVVKSCEIVKHKKTDDVDRFICPNSRHGWNYIVLKLAQIIPDSPNAPLETLKKLNENLDTVLKRHTGDADGLNCHCNGVDDDRRKFCEEFYFNGELLILNDFNDENAFNAFQTHWRKFRPIIVRNCDKDADFDVWKGENLRMLSRKRSLTIGSVQDCLEGRVFVDFDVESFWNGYLDCHKRTGNVSLKLKDWPSDKYFETELPFHYENFCKVLPFAKYSHPTSGVFSLTTHLPQTSLKPDLGPKLYCAYEIIDHPMHGTTNSHIDCSDAVNLLTNVTVPANVCKLEFYAKILRHLDELDLDLSDRARCLADVERVGALWTIFKPEDTETIRNFLKTIVTVKGRNDPIHDQMLYINKNLQRRLREEHNVEGFNFVQMLGDAVFIPSGAVHQVRNLACCVKVAEDFVSPENIDKSLSSDEEFRRLTKKHTSHEDKLQLPNAVLHSVKEAVRILSEEMKL